MGMTPTQGAISMMQAVFEGAEPSLTYRLSEEKKEVRGQTDGMEALEQALKKRLLTQRYRFAIYDDSYGLETEDLIGAAKEYAIPELKRRIEETLLQDDRVKAVTEVTIAQGKDSLTAICTLETVYGTMQAERTVEI